VNSLKLRVPGKLFLLGEYAILEPGSQALLLAVNRYLYADIAPASGYSLTTDLLPEREFNFNWQKHQLTWQTKPESSAFVENSLQWAFTYLESLSIPLLPFRLNLRSDLQTGSAKLGLGSSAAVSVAVLAAVLAFHGIASNSYDERLRLFKLTVLAHSGAQGSGSGADLAAAIFGSVTCYRRYDNSWVKPGTLELEHLLKVNWPLLGIEKLPWPSDLGLTIGWTGQPASTVNFIEEFAYVKDKEPELFYRFLFSANAATAAARNALIDCDSSQLKQSIGQYRHLLQELQSHFLEPIETAKLVALIESAEGLGLVAKSSGAGGGDCGLALGANEKLPELNQTWTSLDIRPLDLELDFEGLCFESF
jgi:phosphomevalonate kinase